MFQQESVRQANQTRLQQEKAMASCLASDNRVEVKRRSRQLAEVEEERRQARALEVPLGRRVT